MGDLGHGLTPILVTGAEGYLGQFVLEGLRRRDRACVGSSRRHELACDLTQRTEVENLLRASKTETVIHCAAQVPKHADAYQDREAAAMNLQMVDNILAARPRHLVFTSSMTVYPETVTMPVREEDAGDPGPDYAGSKRAAELRIEAESRVTATTLRLPGLFGAPRQNGLLYNAARAFASGQSPSLPVKMPLWAAMHVEDAADICVRAALSIPRASRTLNIGYSGSMSIPSVLEKLAELLQAEAPEMGPAPAFEMNLTRLETEIGLPRRTLDDRLAEFALAVRRNRGRDAH